MFLERGESWRAVKREAVCYDYRPPAATAWRVTHDGYSAEYRSLISLFFLHRMHGMITLMTKPGEEKMS